MNITLCQSTRARGRTWSESVGVVVVGAGFAGLYMQNSTREAGFQSVIFEAGQAYCLGLGARAA